MRFLALACDYDGTLATNGQVSEETLAALERLLDSGRKLILVTGRQLDDLQKVFPHLNRFEWVVAENGALLYKPATREEKPLGEPPPPEFVTALREKGVDSLGIGRVIVATWHPYEKTVLEVIRKLGLEHQVILNKDAVMVLPLGVDKASGLNAALSEMSLSPHNTVGIGDAENDQALLGLCGCGVAVANALPVLKEGADFVTKGDRGAGVVELIDKLIASDLEELGSLRKQHRISSGNLKNGE
ncbi:MAG: HAD family phosphatase [Microcoleus sp. SIO2G3]|nr:HAD family phosphatase [Microcoleus sp. SIO2G3]